MTAPVRIDAEAWSDLRFATLARILGYTDRDLALVKVARIWSWQTEHYTPDAPTYVVDQDTVDSALGDGGAVALVRARLAEEVPDGYRIRGSEGRIEWLWHRRKASKRGGAMTREKWQAGTRPGPRPQPGHQALECVPDNNRGPAGPVVARPPGPLPARPQPGPLTLDLDQRSDPLSLRAREDLARVTWAEVSRARVQLASELNLPNVLPLPDRFGVPSEPRGCRDLRDRLREEGDNATTTAKHVLANLIAQAREERSVEWLSEKAFTPGGWQTARNWISGQQQRARRGARAAREAIGAASPRTDHPESPTLKSFGEL